MVVLMVLYGHDILSMKTHPYFMHEIIILFTPFCEAKYNINNLKLCASFAKCINTNKIIKNPLRGVNKLK
jgi:hypothetical protein